jgi:ABC-type phosphate transport system substrate-binding protein
MSNTHRSLTYLAALAPAVFALLLALSISPQVAQAGGDAIVVIVNASNPVDNLSVGDLKKIYLSDRSRWDTGKSVAPVMPAAGAPERGPFLKAVCGMSDGDFSKYFMQAAFTGKSATPPKEVGGASQVKAAVAASAGAIGFIPASEFHQDAGIKAVKVDGADAGSADYKLHM